MLNRLQDVFRSFQQYDVRYVVIGDVAPVWIPGPASSAGRAISRRRMLHCERGQVGHRRKLS